MSTTNKLDEARLSFVFDRFVLIPSRQLLLKDDVAVRIGGRALDILTALVERPGEVVGKQELMARAWSEVVVEDCNLKVNMGVLRKALGDDAGSARFIATVIGRGYRFIAPVRVTGSSSSRVDPVAAPEAVRNGHNLPIGLTRIFGRSEAIEAIRRDLDTSRVVSVVGPGGIGKTTVALAVAESVMPAFGQGVWLVDLSPLEKAALLPNAIAMAVGMTADSPNVLAGLCEHLRDRELLIVLDSCEHVIDHAALCVSTIVAAAPRVKVLATSREPLGVKSERLRRLRGLDTPPDSLELDAEKALTFPAVQLFVDRALDRLETFSMGDADSHVVAEICRKLDGHALAIELVATRIAAFGARGILKQLDDRFRDALALEQRGGPARQRTLAATIDWSYELLTATERAIMRRLATFAGSFDLDSACAVCADERIDRNLAAAGLASLVDKSLVAAELRGLEVSYRQWDTTRSFALDKLADSDEFDEVRRRHAEHFLALAESAAVADKRLPQAQWLARHAHRLDDIRSALSWASVHPDAAPLSVRLTVAAIPFWKRLALAQECRVAAERALESRFQLHVSPQQALTLRQAVAATIMDIHGTLPEVKLALTAALGIAESLGDTKRQLECLRSLSEFELWTGDSHAVLVLAEKMRAIVAEDDASARATADAGTGSALEWLGDLTAARQHLDAAVSRIVGDPTRFDEARYEFNQRLVALSSMTQVLWLQGFPDQAVASAKRQMQEAEASHYAWSYSYANNQSAILALYLRDYEGSVRYMDTGEQRAATHGLIFWRAMAIGGMRARWLLYTGRLVDLSEMREILASMRERGSRMYYPHILTNYGEALARQSDLQAGLAAIDDAVALCKETGQVIAIPEILRIKGNVIRFQDPHGLDAAEDCYLQAIAQARSSGALSWELRAIISLVKLSRARARADRSEDMLAEAYARFTEGFATGDLVRAKALLDSR